MSAQKEITCPRATTSPDRTHRRRTARRHDEPSLTEASGRRNHHSVQPAEAATATVSRVQHSCAFCNGTQWNSRIGRLRDSPDVGVLECQTCGVVVPDGIPKNTIDYANGSMFGKGSPDFAALRMAGLQDNERRVAFVRERLAGKKIVDIGCGTGGFLSLLDEPSHHIGVELDAGSRRFCCEDELRVYEHSRAIPEATREQVQVITLFHVVEHLPDPAAFLLDLVNLFPRAGTAIIEVPSSEDPLLTIAVSKSFTEFTYWSHHPNLHSVRSLSLLLNRLPGSFEITRVQRYGLANHLGWWVDGLPGGDARYPWASGREVDVAYRQAVIAHDHGDTLWALLRLR